MEVTIFEGQGGQEEPEERPAPRAAPRAARGALAPETPPLGFPPGVEVAPKAKPLPPAPSFSLPKGGPPLVPVPPPVDMARPAPPKLGRELTLQVGHQGLSKAMQGPW